MFVEKIKNYTLKNYLNNGVSGVIFLTEKENSEEKFVTKVIRIKDQSQSSITMLKNEVNILRMVSHENIVRYVDSIEKNETFYLIMEYIKGYTLRELLVKHAQKMKRNLPESFVRNIARQICSALEYLHSLSIVHRDLKLENIMFEFPKDQETFDNLENVKGMVKIIDFGFSRISNKEEMMSSVFGTPVTMSPQILESIYTGQSSQYDYKTDIWSIGIIIYELLFGCLPFKSDSIKILMDNHKIGNYYINIKQNISKEFVLFIQGLLQFDPNKRKDWKIIMNQVFIRGDSETKTLDLGEIEKNCIESERLVLNIHKFIFLEQDKVFPKKTVCIYD
jgi:serine/threonine protein kinase